MTKLLIVLRRSAEYSKPYYDALRSAFPEVTVDMVDHVDKAGSYLADADILVTFGPHMTDEAFARATRLKWVQSLGTGVDAIIHRPMPKDTIITTIRGIHAAPVSEAALLSMLALSRDFPQALRAQDRRLWERDGPMPRTVDGKTVGIFGLGLIAEGLAPRCKALGMTVIGITAARREVAGFDRVHDRGDLLSVVRELDFLVLLTPYTPETHHIIDDAVFAAMKPTAGLVNLARGGVTDEAALARALNAGSIAGAAVDVFVTEPLPPESPLWSARNIILTPHLAGGAVENRDKTIALISENLRRFLAGDYAAMINVVRR